MPRDCPICVPGTASYEPFLDENLDSDRITGLSFASRKTPEFMCHRLVRCTTCDVVYADSPPDDHMLAAAYHQAEYDSSEEAQDAAQTYLAAIAPILSQLDMKHSALEIGTGNGAFLSCLQQLGFNTIVGIEPSADAIEAALPAVRPLIVHGIFDVDNFAPNSFDVVCCFMTLEHVHDPRMLMESVLTILRPGGVFISITHDYRSWVNLLLGKRSPIIDLEHMQIFSRKSIRTLFDNVGYQNIHIKTFKNKYSIQYWVKLLPIPLPLKKNIVERINKSRLSKFKLSLGVGNTLTVGYRPV
jgi:SAM-dependent methyltransferase